MDFEIYIEEANEYLKDLFEGCNDVPQIEIGESLNYGESHKTARIINMPNDRYGYILFGENDNPTIFMSLCNDEKTLRKLEIDPNDNAYFGEPVYSKVGASTLAYKIIELMKFDPNGVL